MSSALDRELNEAIVNGDIGNSYEEFLAIRSLPDRRTADFY